jgi:hypothetical protein
MVRTAYLAQSAIAGFLIAAPIGDTTVLLMFSLSLEILLTLMLLRERRSRLSAGAWSARGQIVRPFPLLARRVPQLRTRRVVVSHSFVTSKGPSPGWRTASRKATS